MFCCVENLAALWQPAVFFILACTGNQFWGCKCGTTTTTTTTTTTAAVTVAVSCAIRTPADLATTTTTTTTTTTNNNNNNYYYYYHYYQYYYKHYNNKNEKKDTDRKTLCHSLSGVGLAVLCQLGLQVLVGLDQLDAIEHVLLNHFLVGLLAMDKATQG